MLYRVGRGLQLLGLLITPIGVAGNVAGREDLKGPLGIAAVGIAVFLVGWLLQQTKQN